MRIAALLLVAALGAGCAHTAVGVSNSGTSASTSGGTSISTGSAGAALALVLTFGMIDYVNNPRPFPNPSSLMSPASPAVPEMATSRRISEQDCSKPVDLTLGNLRCK